MGAVMSIERDLIESTAEGMRNAAKLIRSRTVMLPIPGKTVDGHAQIGRERRLHLYPITDTEADYLMQSQLVKARGELDVRILECAAAGAPLSPARIAVTYVVAGIIGGRVVADWQPLWAALKSRNYAMAVVELLRCNLLKLIGETEANQLRVAEMIAIMSSGEIPATDIARRPPAGDEE